MEIRMAIRVVLLVFNAILVAYLIRVAVRNIRASRMNPQIKEDSKAVAARIKKMLPLAGAALLVLVFLNVAPIIFFR